MSMEDTIPRIEDIETDRKGHNPNSTQSADVMGNPVSTKRPSGLAPQRKQKSKSSAHRSTKMVVTGQETTKAQLGRKTGAWTKAEVKALWDALGLLPVKPRWDDVAAEVPGRDKLSCQNKVTSRIGARPEEKVQR